TVTGGTATQLSVTVPSITGGNYIVSVQRASDSGTQTSQELFSVATGGGYFGATVGDSERIVSKNAGYAESVYAADVNGDGDMDLVFASQTNHKIAWYENDGNESFTERIVSTNAGNARSVHAADVDGDGDIDLMSASENDDKIAWYENDGSESFTEHVVSTIADGAFDVFAADMDGDGDLDLMSASIYDNKIAWYENDGSESFTEHVVSTNADFATSVHAADVDGDGDLDLMSASWNDDKIAWYENDGSESFTEHVVSTTAIIAHSVYAADVDGDGDLDLMSASVNGNKIAWYENDGSESFTERIVSTTADGAYSVYAADMDGDGDIDLMSASQRDDKIAWYENDGSESFTERIVSTTADRVHSVYAADMDGDGDLDLMSTSIYDGKIAWYENNSSPFKITQSQPLNGAPGTPITIYGIGFDSTSIDYTVTFTPAGGGTGATATVTNGTSTQLSVTVPSVTGGNYMISVKRDSDNYTDSLATFFTVISGGGDFGAAGSGEQVVSTAADGIQSVHASDVDGDGDIDFMSASENIDEIAWHENDGSQNFTKRVVSTDAFFARDVYAADVDGDGDMDLLSASAADQKIAWYENDGATDPTFTEHVVTSSADGANSVFAIDVDGDGDTDLMTATSVDDEILWFENDGSQNFTEHVVSSTADGAFDVFAIDVDGDGDIDLLSASSEDDKIAWYENDGSQNFTERVVSTNANFPHTVFAADMDDDGDIDLLSASQSDDKIAWYKNDGSQNFTEVAISTSGDRAISVYAADMNADGDMDIVSTFAGDDKITWYKNDGAANPSFTENIISNSADGAHSIFVADVDNNGTLDVIAGSENDDKIAWYKNGSAISTAGRSLAFDGTGDFIEVADTNALDLTNSFTLEAWVKTSFGASAKHVIYKEGAYALTIQNTSISLNINDVDEYEFNYNFTPNAWVHVAVTFDPSKDATYFVNGKMIGYVTGSSTPNNSAHPLLLGGNSSSGSINGNLDEVRIWNEVRTITEIQTNMFQALSGNEDDLVAYFPFNEENGAKTTDQTSNSFSGGFNGNVTQSTDTHPYGTVILGNEGWRMLSAPVVNTSYGTLLDTLWTQGFTGADNANFSPNVLVWDETAKSFSAIDDATDIPGTASGFITFVYDDQDKNGVADGFPKLIQTDSTQFSGNISPSLTFTDSDNLANDGWNLVGNPYGSTIDWDAASGLTSSNLDASFYVWSSSANSGSGSYLSWNGSTGTLSGGKISPWQGFWVKANATSPSLTLTNDARSSSGTFLKKKEIPVLTFTVKGNDLESSTIVSLQADASIDKDKYDAYKLGSLNETFLSLFTALGDGTTLDINALPIDLKDALSIPFDVDGSNLNGAFQLNWNTQSLPDEWTFTLINNMTGEEVNLLEESALDFELNTPAKEISAKENNSLMTPTHGIIQPNILKAKEVNASRFTLRIVPAGVSVNTENEIELPTSVELQQNYPNPFNPSTTIAFGLPESGKVTLEVFDVLGRKVATLLNGDNKSAGRYTVNFDASSLSSGMYIYRLQVGNSVITKKLTLIK
ncbi:MAG: FG-GAP-like repeat-containing protein, partial [Balneola sp.]